MNPHINRENLLNFQNLTPDEYESLRHRYLELLLLGDRMTKASEHRMNSMANRTEDKLPDEYLVAFEEGMDFCKNFVCGCLSELVVAIQNYERNKFPESYEDEAYGQDSSDEIEHTKEVAKANNYRTKRSKFRPDDVLNA
jgi:hypothetical protein